MGAKRRERLTIHERLALRRVRETQARIERYGEEEAARLRQEEVTRLQREARAARSEEALRKAGLDRRGYRKVSPDELAKAFLALKGRAPSRTEACRRVARKFSVAPETVRKYTKHLPWK